MDIRFPDSALRAAADAAAAASRLNGANSSFGGLRIGDLQSGGSWSIGSVQPTSQPGFASALTDALQQASRAQDSASRLQQDFQLGVPGATLEQTMVSMQKAQLSFQAAVTMRNRLLSAYTDIMNMQV